MAEDGILEIQPGKPDPSAFQAAPIPDWFIFLNGGLGKESNLLNAFPHVTSL